MAKLGGVALKSLQLFLRFVEFCCAAIILGIFSYFLATLHNHGLRIDTWIRAVEGISGAAVVWTLLCLLFVCCLGGVAFLSFLAMILDFAFCGAFIYVAWANRHGDGSCKGNVDTPFGSGNTNVDNSVPSGKNGFTHLPSLHQACQLETACFAVAIVGLVFFLLSIFAELALARHHRREKAFGPSPNNGYTAGSPKRKFWQRRKNRTDREFVGDKNPNALPPHATPADLRDSYATESTAVGQEPAYNKYGNTVDLAHGYQTTTTTHNGYHAGTAGNNF